MDIELWDDLVGSCVVGDVVVVTGIVKVLATGDDLGEREKGDSYRSGSEDVTVATASSRLPRAVI